jgi:hypothetical protein
MGHYLSLHYESVQGKFGRTQRRMPISAKTLGKTSDAFGRKNFAWQKLLEKGKY